MSTAEYLDPTHRWVRFAGDSEDASIPPSTRPASASSVGFGLCLSSAGASDGDDDRDRGEKWVENGQVLGAAEPVGQQPIATRANKPSRTYSP